MILEVDKIDAHYGDIPVLRDASLSVGHGEIVALLGSNGAGKTTTLRAISNIIQIQKGNIKFLGKTTKNVPSYQLAQQGLCHVPERRGIFQNLTVWENLRLGAYSKRILHKKDLDWIHTLFPILKERMKQLAGTLSGGEQQMLAMGRALLGKPKLLLLDEPSLGLAPQITKHLFNIIKEINNSGTAVLLVEQNALQALQISHRAYIIEVGAITYSSDSKSLLKDDIIKKAYLGVHGTTL